MSEPAPQVPTTPKPTTYPEEFETWWRTYPRRKNASKRDALRQWREASKAIDPDELLRLTAIYADNPGVSDSRYIPHPQKWLKDRRWESVDETNNHVIQESEQRAVTAASLLENFYQSPPQQHEEIEGEVIPWQLEA